VEISLCEATWKVAQTLYLLIEALLNILLGWGAGWFSMVRVTEFSFDASLPTLHLRWSKR
jgi:hypothetical protein